VRVVLAEPVTGHGQHPAGATRRVIQALHHRAPARERLGVGREQQLDHEPDHLAGREVLARRLVRLLREAPDQLLVEVAHRLVGHGVGVEVDRREA
jgi:hypothetical protein